MPTAEERKRIDPNKCVICQQSLGQHSMKVKLDKRVRRICNRVDEDHANWLLDHKMDTNYLRITGKRRSGIMGIIILMMAFVVLIWAFVYTTDSATMFMLVAAVLSVLIGLFVVAEFRIITVSDRMRSLLRDVEMERPIVSPLPHPALDRLDAVAALAGEAEPDRGRVAIHPTAEPAPTTVAAPGPSSQLEDGIPGVPQPVVSPNEWEVMDVAEPATSASQPPPGTPPLPVPPPPLIEDLPGDVPQAPALAQPVAPPPLQATGPGLPAQVPPAPPQPPVQSPPAQPMQAPPASPRPAVQSPPTPPRPPVQAPPPQPQPPAQAPPITPRPPVQAPSTPPRPPVQAPPTPPRPPVQAPPTPPRPTAQTPPTLPTPPKRPTVEEEVEEVEWVDWE